MLYFAIGIKIFTKYNFQGKKCTVIAMLPKHSFLLIMGGKKQTKKPKNNKQKLNQISLKTNIPILTRPNPKFYPPISFKNVVVEDQSNQ